MENIIKIFANEEFGRVRTVIIKGEPWFVLADVCKALEISNSRMVASRLDSDELMSVKLTSGGQRREMTVVSESGLYDVILRSDKPQAKYFCKWVTTKILPTIRRTGGYVANVDMFIENYLPFLDEPLVEFANQVSNTDNLIDMNAMAKLAVEEDIPIGRNRMFRWLRENEILMSGNLPYQKYIDRGYFAVKESVFEMDSMCRTYQQTFVTGKGQQYIIGRLKKEFCNEI